VAHQKFLIVGMIGPGGPELLATDHQFITVDDAAAAEGRQVGAGIRLEKPWHQSSSPFRIGCRWRTFWSSLPRAIRVGPAWFCATKRKPIGGPPARAYSLVPNYLLDDGKAAASVFHGPVQARPAGVMQNALPGAIKGRAGGGVGRAPLLGKV